LGGRLFERAQGIEFESALPYGPRRLALGPEITEKVVGQHRAETMGDNDDALVMRTVMQGPQQFEPAVARRNIVWIGARVTYNGQTSRCPSGALAR
jgi:hypothetical protein